MRLERIKLAGFKSFVEPATIELPTNLVGIVGPNGCGKSNVIDAVRWVMGESSAKTLRGESMSDVIFNGSVSRKPVSRASVELVFDNSDGQVGGQYAQYSQLSVRREVSRDGQSQYYLNGSRCRRRDITEIFLGTGLGPRSYSIIEQGMISRVIDAKPEDLRAHLEEAAGISKYKERRRETENRIRHTRENLERLDDLREEVTRQLEKLKRQARAAERYKELKAEERRFDAELLALRLQGLRQTLAKQDQAISQAQTALEEAITTQRSAERDLTVQRDGQVESQEHFNEAQGRFYAVGADIARLEQTIAHAKETHQRQQRELSEVDNALQRVESEKGQDETRLTEARNRLAEARPALESAREQADAVQQQSQTAQAALAAWRDEWSALTRAEADPSRAADVARTRANHLESQLLQGAKRLADLAEQAQRFDLPAVQAELETLETQAEERQVAAQQARETWQAARSERDVARQAERETQKTVQQARSARHEVERRHAALDARQQAALVSAEKDPVNWLRQQGLDKAPRLASGLKVDAGWELAVERVLGEWLGAVVSEQCSDLGAALANAEAAGAKIWCGNNQGPSAAGVTLADKVSGPSAAISLLGQVRIADNANMAMSMRGELSAGQSCITQGGFWCGPDWLRGIPGKADGSDSVLAREEELRGLSVKLAEAVEALTATEQKAEQSIQQNARCERHVESTASAREQAERASNELQSRLHGLRARAEQMQDRMRQVEKERANIEQRRGTDQAELQQVKQQVNNALAKVEDYQGQRTALDARRQQVEQQYSQAQANARAAQQQAHQLELEINSLQNTAQSADGAMQRHVEQLRQWQQRREQIQETLRDAGNPLAELEGQLAAELENRIIAEQALAKARDGLSSIDQQIKNLEQQRGSAEQLVAQRREALDAKRMARQQDVVRADALQEQLAESDFQEAQLLSELPDEATPGIWQEKLNQVGERIRRLGAINLAAIEEFDEQSKRKEYLDEQNADLLESLETLESAMAKIDRETRTKFKETFDKVDAGLKKMFPKLFGGGHAYLELTGNDLLETGVSIMARPPGKRNASIQLLSGGEKALTAVALVFSIFELNPAPFCLLDEVDAPLDDANVGRFSEMVRTMSENVQFLFITHNKLTMEIAHQLMGVTMHEPGVSRPVSVDVDAAAAIIDGTFGT